MAKTLRNSTDRILSISAIAIGVFTFLVYVYQSSIMTAQMHASVWPYLEWARNYNDTEGFYLAVSNKGIGPAKVIREQMWLADTLLNNAKIDPIIVSISQNEKTNYSYSTLEGRVLAPGESIRRIQLYDLEQAKRIDSLLSIGSFRYDVTFCSVYGDCWVSSGLRVVEVNE